MRTHCALFLVALVASQTSYQSYQKSLVALVASQTSYQSYQSYQSQNAYWRLAERLPRLPDPKLYCLGHVAIAML